MRHNVTMFGLTPFLAAVLVVQAGEPVSRIAFGSCANQGRPMPVFQAVEAFDPDVWIWMGDTIYADTLDMDVMKSKYRRLSENPDYAAVANDSVVLGTWDDHDYGENNAGKEYPKKVEAQSLLLDFLGVPTSDPRRERKGVYASHTFGPEGREVRVILLDTRYHRDPPGPEGDILGEDQWAWLESQLVDSPAEVHLLISSIQVLPTEHRFEKWANFPQARQRLLELLSRKDVPPVTLLSGDRHLGEISRETEATPYALHEITASGLTHYAANRQEQNRRRIGKNYCDRHFGALDIDWSESPPRLDFTLRDEEGAIVRSVEIQQER